MRLTDAHKPRVSLAVFALTALMSLNVVFQLGMHVKWRHWIPATLAAGSAASQPADTQPASDTTAARPAKAPPVHAAIRKRNVMTQPVPKGHGMQLTGVLGNIALFTTRDGKTVDIEAGQSEQGIKVTAVDGYSVTIEYEGQSETMKLFPDETRPGPSPAPPASGPPAPEKTEPTSRKAKPPTGPAEAAGEEVPSTHPSGAMP